MQSGALVPCTLLGGASLERTILILRSPEWKLNKLRIWLRAAWQRCALTPHPVKRASADVSHAVDEVFNWRDYGRVVQKGECCHWFRVMDWILSFSFSWIFNRYLAQYWLGSAEKRSLAEFISPNCRAACLSGFENSPVLFCGEPKAWCSWLS